MLENGFKKMDPVTNALMLQGIIDLVRNLADDASKQDGEEGDDSDDPRQASLKLLNHQLLTQKHSFI